MERTSHVTNIKCSTSKYQKIELSFHTKKKLFYRHLIHAFGAPGSALIRIVKSDDDELEDIAEDFLLFHDEIPEEESLNVKISFEVTPTLDANSKFKLKLSL